MSGFVPFPTLAQCDRTFALLVNANPGRIRFALATNAQLTEVQHTQRREWRVLDLIEQPADLTKAILKWATERDPLED